MTNRSEEHTSELQSLRHLVCRLLLEKKSQRDPCPHPSLPPSCATGDEEHRRPGGRGWGVPEEPCRAGPCPGKVRVGFVFFLTTGPPPNSTLFPAPRLSR